jgi:DNA helicase II / ATP-dependent DNA helicase PcrA
MVRLALRHAKRFAEMSAAYLDKLNADQRRAVLHGVDGAGDTALLIIAGAGSGKTATLAHRVVHLVANGADPRRILLMTFSRRAAVEMTRRVERIGPEASAVGQAGARACSSARSLAR